MKFSSVMFLSITTLVMSTLMMISSNSWISLWICLELNMFMFVPVIMWDKLDWEEEGAVKYFVIQSLASALLLISIFYSYNLWGVPLISMLMLILSVFMKLGSFPFIFWYISVMKSISWFSCMVLSTWQKLGPLSILIFYMNFLPNLVMLVSVINVFVGGWGGCLQSDLRTLMAYSSVSHLGWMMSVLNTPYKMFSMTYFIFYVLLILPIFIILMMMNVKKLSSLFSLSKMPLSYLLSLMLLLLSLGGVPPMSGFLPKLMILNILVYENLVMSVIMVIFSLMSLYMYMNMFFTMFIFYYINLELKLEFNYVLLMSILISFCLMPMVMI
uniref:NADH-ubiquinone oxidoreductase chain 2 n=1 Tax=Whitmania acranulata TaxID=1329092 RepID=A0A0F6PBM7_WHICA|nr:NADH dehydrogenase subunit 2 [Whitmania acranulata]